MTSNYYNPYYTTSSSAAASNSDVAGIVAFILGLGILFWLIAIAVIILVLVARWKTFKKANINGWEALIPVHSDIVELQLGDVSTAIWFLNLIAICGIGPIIFAFWKNIALAKAFGKGAGFGVLLTFFPFVCYPILGFGKAEYVGINKNDTTTNTTENV